ncbi:trypsin-like serine protease [Pseudoalteromonas galatheae]|uniref:trypsin-like serine protease n=1 Tax=Pseudoalteromonas galatheae TaxID=579562 RepID=UPI001109C043|nr:trypsin-like serine protease [Pseudoalteromonas galatheae]NKC20797.1 trypsin-like serine protease [Pseudoalteromonas galatheae]
MRFWLLIILGISFNSYSIVIRHDVDDANYKVSSNVLPQLATFYIDGGHGTLIDSKWVLTAAHATFCLQPNSTILINNTPTLIEQVFVHTGYMPGQSHDIALIKLKQAVSDVKPFKINRKIDELDKVLWFIGMGGTGTGITGQTIDNLANQGQMRRAQNTVIVAKGPLLKFSFDRGDKALPLEGVSGGGDSGGPAYQYKGGQGVVLGVSSRVEGGRIGRYGVTEIYSRVSYFVDWIDSIIAGKNVATLATTTLTQLPAGLTDEILPQVCEEIKIKSSQ